jgi:hypothetical protein
MKSQSIELGRGTLVGRTALEAGVVHIPDVKQDIEPLDRVLGAGRAKGRLSA